MRALSFLDFEGAYGSGSMSGRKCGYPSVCRKFPEWFELWVFISVETEDTASRK
jgi:hypothetical protein